MTEYDLPPVDTGYPPADGDILTELLIASQVAEAERLAEEALEEGDTLHNPIRYGAPSNGSAPSITPEPLLDPSLAAKNPPTVETLEFPTFEDTEPDIPDGAFLLRCQSGDVCLWPEGISFEQHFIVLFFKSQRDLHFTPRLRTTFQGQYDLSGDGEDLGRQSFDLFYSGITFTLPDKDTIAVIFHLYADTHTPTGFVASPA